MNKKEKSKQLKNKNGITLIALVVTIIVLIILAAVSISLILGENGIITKSRDAARRTEEARLNEEVQLNEAVEYLENLGGSSNPSNPETPTETKTVEELKTAQTYMTEKITIEDSNGNKIVVPEGFKIAEDSGINVTEGIVIEDNDIIEGVGNGRGNQYVWIPVGENIKKENKETGTIEEVDITLGRYVFADGTNHKDAEGVVLPIGTPILKQSAENYEEVVTIESYYQELATSRIGQVNESDRLQDTNTTALNLKGFVDSVKANGGYYIARYEASYGTDGKANSKVSNNPNDSSSAPTTEGYLWNNITQINAAAASRSLYTTINSDLMNSYAWDTAIVYIQAFSGDTDYSRQNGKSINSSLTNTGVNNDEVCKINDMASNTYEWTTEYSTYAVSSGADPCTNRGGFYNWNSTYASIRGGYGATYSNKFYAFRPALYM